MRGGFVGDTVECHEDRVRPSYRQIIRTDTTQRNVLQHLLIPVTE